MPLKATDGGRRPRATDGDILNVFRETSDPVLSTAEVADALPIQRRGTLNRLRRLQEDGRLNSKQIGGRNTVWWLTDRTASTAPSGSPPPTDDDPPRSREGDVTGDESEKSEAEEVATPERSDAEESDDALAADVRAFLSGRPPKTSHGQDAVVDVFQLLREWGTMKTGELKSALYEDYADHYGSERGMWESVSRYLEDVPGVEKGGYGEWTYAGDDVTREELS
jgi:DNA-binding Lrp family transcriptional regulator